MPEISRFLGISIRMFRDEHPPPHFHAIYNEYAAQISIRQPALLNGRLPPRVLGYVLEWAAGHEADLMRCWDSLQGDRPVEKIEPLV